MDAPNRSMARRWPAPMLLVAVFLAVAVPLIASGFMKGRGASDQVNYHERVIRQFAREWPRADFSDYVSATTPLYHWLLAGWEHLAGPGVRALQAVGAVFTVALLGAVGWGAGGRSPPGRAMAVGLPLACSLYVISSGVWLLPDNLAWLGVALVLMLMMRDSVGAREVVASGIALLAVVLARQSHLWLAAVVWAGAWLNASPAPGLFSDPARRARMGALALGATLPAFGAVAFFWKLWGGRLNPPAFDAWYTHAWSPQAPAFVLALFGIYSAFFAADLLPALRSLAVKRVWMLGLALGVGVVVATAAPTIRDAPLGRYGGIWDLTAHLPAVSGRSVLIGVLAVGGALACACWCEAVPSRAGWIVLTALAGFSAAQARNPWLYQRYAEPLLLMLCALAGARIPPPAPGAPLGAVRRFGRIAGPMALAALLGAVTAREIQGAADVVVIPEGTVGPPPGTPKAQ